MIKYLRAINNIVSVVNARDLVIENRTKLVIDFFKNYLGYYGIKNDGVVYTLSAIFGDGLLEVLKSAKCSFEPGGYLFSKKFNKEKLYVSFVGMKDSIIEMQCFPYDLSTSISLSLESDGACTIFVKGASERGNVKKETRKHTLSIFVDNDGLIKNFCCYNEEETSEKSSEKHATTTIMNGNESGYMIQKSKFVINENGERKSIGNSIEEDDYALCDVIPMTVPIRLILESTNRGDFQREDGIGRHLAFNLAKYFPQLDETLAEYLQVRYEEQNKGSR
jgi:hypothetical protein